MAISPQVILFVIFMLTVVGATRLDEARQHRRASAIRGTRDNWHLLSDAVKRR